MVSSLRGRIDVETSVMRAPEDRHERREGSRLLRRDPRDKGPGSETMKVAPVICGSRAGFKEAQGSRDLRDGRVSEKLKVARIPRRQQGSAG